jgi:ubiquinone/menaquinone biosynthesis C-methylase UbiE
VPSAGDYFDARVGQYLDIYRHHGVSPLGIYYWLRWHPLHRYRQIVRAALAEVDGQRIVDLGCGVGTYALDLAARGAHVTAVDVAPSMLAQTRRGAGLAGLDGRIDCIHADGAAWLAGSGRVFDVALAIGVFDYVDDPARWLRVIRHHCRMLIATFPRQSMRQMAASWRYRRAGLSSRVYTLEQLHRWLAASDWHSVRVTTPAFGGYVVIASRPKEER